MTQQEIEKKEVQKEQDVVEKLVAAIAATGIGVGAFVAVVEFIWKILLHQ